MFPVKIISGGQTGADRAALDAALLLGLPAGGWVPKGRLAEDGAVPARYEGLVEASSESYEERTELNVRDSDATVIFTFGPPAGGSAHAEAVARSMSRPVLCVDLDRLTTGQAVMVLRQWLTRTRPLKLNVAGPRESREPRIYEATLMILREAFEPFRS